MTLTLAHIDGDCGNFTSGNTYDTFEVRNGGAVVAVLRATYNEGASNIECSEINHTVAVGIFSTMHLIACVTATIMRAFTQDHEFYCEAFTDSEGNSVELPLFDPAA